MTMPSDNRAEAELDLLLDAARRAPPAPDDAFLARVLADALQVQADARAPGPQPVPRRARRAGFWARLVATLGGAFALAGFGSAAMAGLVIGYVQPEQMIDLAGAIGLVSGESLDLLPGFDALLTEDLSQ